MPIAKDRKTATISKKCRLCYLLIRYLFRHYQYRSISRASLEILINVRYPPFTTETFIDRHHVMPIYTRWMYGREWTYRCIIAVVATAIVASTR